METTWRAGVAAGALAALAAFGCAETGLCAAAADRPTDVFLLIGQSNMAGRGALTDELRLSTERVLKWDEKSGKWVEAVEPIVSDRPFSGAGLAASFARSLADARKDRTIGLVPAAEGGSPLSRFMPGGDLYVRAVDRTRAALKAGGELKGILWHQGCADSESLKTATNYAARLSVMVESLRKDLGAKDAPFVAGELGRYLGHRYAKHYKVVNEQLHEMAKTCPNMAVVSSRGLTPNEDGLHFNTISLRTFGERYAKAYMEMPAVREKWYR